MTNKRLVEPCSILVVDYVEDERVMYEEALHAAGFVVRVLSDATGALEEAAIMQPDAVITRIMQPGSAFDGIELARRLKKHPATRRAAVIIVTSRMEAAYRTAALDAGCDGYLMILSS
jgi:CheY-like chemotaxis protein